MSQRGRAALADKVALARKQSGSAATWLALTFLSVEEINWEWLLGLLLGAVDPDAVLDQHVALLFPARERLVVWLAREIQKVIKANRARWQVPYDRYDTYHAEIAVRGDLPQTHYLDEVVDWATATHPVIMRFSFEDAVDEADAWHHALAAKGGRKIARDDRGEVVHAWPDGWTVQKLSADQLAAEGDAMGHCVGGPEYVRSVRSHRARIYSIRDPKNQPHVTIEISTAYQHHSVRQAQGRGDTPPHKYAGRITDFLRSLALPTDKWGPALWYDAAEAGKRILERLDLPLMKGLEGLEGIAPIDAWRKVQDKFGNRIKGQFDGGVPLRFIGLRFYATMGDLSTYLQPAREALNRARPRDRVLRSARQELRRVRYAFNEGAWNSLLLRVAQMAIFDKIHVHDRYTYAWEDTALLLGDYALEPPSDASADEWSRFATHTMRWAAPLDLREWKLPKDWRTKVKTVWTDVLLHRRDLLDLTLHDRTESGW